MSGNPSAIKSVSETPVQPFLNRIGSIQLQGVNGERIVTPFRELSTAEQEKIGRLIQLFLRSRSFLTHLQNHRGIYNIVLRDGEKPRIIVAGKTFDLKESKEADSDKEKPADDLLTQVQNLSEGVAITVDSLSIFRNAISAIATAALANPHSFISLAVESAGTIGGVAATVGGPIMMSKGVQKIANAKEEEEFNLGLLQTVSGAGYLGFGLSSILYRVSSFFGSAAGITQAFATFALNPSLYFMNVGFALWGTYQIAIAGSFRSELNQAIEKGGTRGGIDFLYENLFPTKEEQAELDKIADPEKKAEEMKQILERKRAHLERRIGTVAASEIAPEIEEVKRRFDEKGDVDGAHLEKAHFLIDKALKGNYQELAKAALFVTLAVLSIASIAALGPTGTFAFLVALGILWLINDCTTSADFTSEQLWKLHQKILSLIVVAIEGKDEKFMEYLYFLDPELKSAAPEVQAEAYVDAFTDREGEFYRLYRKILEEKKDAEAAQAYLQMLREIRQATLAGDLDTPEACLDHLYSATPLFFEWMNEHMSKDEVRDALAWFWPKAEGFSNGIGLKLAALGMLDALFEGRSRYKNHQPIEAALTYFDDAKKEPEEKEHPLVRFFRALIASDPALQETANVDDARVHMQKHLNTFMDRYSDARKREAIFGRFSPEQIRALAAGEEEGIPLMQLGCSFSQNPEFSSLGSGKTAYQVFAYPELLLTPDETSILQRHREFQERASRAFPQVYEHAMRNPTLEGRSIQNNLLVDILDPGKKVINGEEITLPNQTVADFHRAPDTRFADEVIPGGEEGGARAILRLREMAKGDTRLFLLLAALYGQTAKNFVLFFQEELKKQGVLAGLYAPFSKVREQSFTENRDGSFEIQYDFEFTLTSELDGSQIPPILLRATYRLEKENGEWVCQNPIYSGTIEPDGHPSRADRLSRSSPF